MENKEDLIKNIYQDEYARLCYDLANYSKAINIQWDIEMGKGICSDELYTMQGLNEVIKQCLIVTKVYSESKNNINPGYAREKLLKAKRNLDEALVYFSKLMDQEEAEEVE